MSPRQVDGKEVAEHNSREKVSPSPMACSTRLISLQGVWIVVHGKVISDSVN